jgi:D-hexose-6-phosphate mutarotase
MFIIVGYAGPFLKQTKNPARGGARRVKWGMADARSTRHGNATGETAVP